MGCDFLPFWPSLAGLSESSTTGGPAIVCLLSERSVDCSCGCRRFRILDFDPDFRRNQNGKAHRASLKQFPQGQAHRLHQTVCRRGLPRARRTECRDGSVSVFSAASPCVLNTVLVGSLHRRATSGRRRVIGFLTRCFRWLNGFCAATSGNRKEPQHVAAAALASVQWSSGWTVALASSPYYGLPPNDRLHSLIFRPAVLVI
jgi:hypothetical protein